MSNKNRRLIARIVAIALALLMGVGAIYALFSVVLQ